jgi:hypothetical protein
MQHNGLTNEFLLRLGENERPAKVPEADWPTHAETGLLGNSGKNNIVDTEK